MFFGFYLTVGFVSCIIIGTWFFISHFEQLDKREEIDDMFLIFFGAIAHGVLLAAIWPITWPIIILSKFLLSIKKRS